MYNLLLSLAAGVLVATAIGLLGFGWVAVIVPGVLAAAIAYVALNLRTQKRLSAVIEAAVAEAQARRFDRAIQLARSGIPLGRWIFGAGAAISALIGQFLWWKGDQEAALPWLEKAPSGQWPARIMLAVARWKRRDVAGMQALFEQMAKSRGCRKQGLVWCAYAWLLEKEGRHDEAVRAIGRGVQASPSDEKLKIAQQALQNGKRLKVGKLYMEWYSYGLETPPPVMPPGFRAGKRATYR